MARTAVELHDFLRPEPLVEVVDIGANPIDGDPPYARMLAEGLCRVTGFEPQARPLAELQRAQGANERYLPYAIGDGRAHTLKVCRGSGMTSLFEPDPVALAMFNTLGPVAEVVERVPVQTRRLDDVAEIEHADFLKMDIQGGELAVLQNGRERLSECVAIQTEVSFVALYKGQPGFGEVDGELRRQGFIPHCFASVKRRPIAPCVAGGDPRTPLNQLLEADIVYVRDFTRPDAMSNEQLKRMALIAHACYGSYDLALRCVMLLEQRGALNAGARTEYLQIIGNGQRTPY